MAECGEEGEMNLVRFERDDNYIVFDADDVVWVHIRGDGKMFAGKTAMVKFRCGEELVVYQSDEPELFDEFVDWARKEKGEG